MSLTPEFLTDLQTLSSEIIFGEQVLDTGKHAGKRLQQIWLEDRNYLLWSANLAKNPCTYPPPRYKVELVKIAHLLESGDEKGARKLLNELHAWQQLTEEGIGLSDLPRPSKKECLEIISSCNLLGGHCDLDGIYSLASAICSGGALGGPKAKNAFSRLRLFRYGFRHIQDYSQAIGMNDKDTLVVIDFSAHPQAALNLDHHTTSLSYWELGAPIPKGIYESSMPSCPRLLSTYCGLDIAEDILTGCDMVDGAMYKNVEQTTDLKNPYVALEHALSLDVSDIVAKKVVLTLAENNLDPLSVLGQPIWKSRLELLELELAEQRSYWQKPNRIRAHGKLIAVADARLAPYSASRFRYLPFELDEVHSRPYLVTIRPSGHSKVNLGTARNPFYSEPEFYKRHPLNLGTLAKSLGKGGGRQEVASLTIDIHCLNTALEQTLSAIERSAL